MTLGFFGGFFVAGSALQTALSRIDLNFDLHRWEIAFSAGNPCPHLHFCGACQPFQSKSGLRLLCCFRETNAK